MSKKLNLSILDQSWYEFRRQLEYKQVWLEGKVTAVNPCNTSRTCLNCGLVARENRWSQNLFLCKKCGYSENANFVAACNMLMSMKHTGLACGDTKPFVA